MRVAGTGHQRLQDPAGWAWAKQAISHELDRLTPPLVGITCLAIGADQLISKLVLSKGGEIHAVLPFLDIERTFAPSDLAAYRMLLGDASVEVLSISGTDEDSYLAGGRRVVDLSDLVFAVWDGLPPKGKGGTADIVAYAIENNKPVVHFNPVDRSISRYGPG